MAVVTLSLSLAFNASAGDRISELNARMAAQKAQPGAGYSGSKKIEISRDTTEINLPKESLLSSVVFVSDGLRTVILPKGAILHQPSSCRLTIGDSIVGELVQWEDFQAFNRASLNLINVTAENLGAGKVLAPEEIAAVQKIPGIAVTVFQNRPVALPSKP